MKSFIRTALRTIGMLLGLLMSISPEALAVTSQISAGVASTAALKQDGTVWGVGSISGFYPGALQPTRLFPSIGDAVQIGNGGADYALRSNGELWASGANWVGQIGDGTTNTRDRNNPYKVLDGVAQFAVNYMTAMALQRDGTVWAWGANSSGQLGDGTRISRLAPVRVNGLVNVAMIAAGSNSSAALTIDGQVWAWGDKNYIADGDTTSYLPDDPRIVILTPKQVPILTNIVSIKKGTLALDRSGRLWSFGTCWFGMGGNGLGLENCVAKLPVQVQVSGKVIAYSVGQNHCLAVTDDGSVWVWGKNASGQFGVPFSGGLNPTPAKISLPGPAIDVAAGSTHSAVLLADGRVMTFGDDSNSQLGRGLFQSDYAPGFMVSETGTGSFSAITPAPANMANPPTLGISAPSAVNGRVKGFVPLAVSLTANGNAASGHSINRYDWVSSDGSMHAQGTNVGLAFTNPGAIDVYAIATDDSGLRGAALQHILALPQDVPVSITPQIVSAGNTFNSLSNKGAMYTWGAP